MGHMRLYAWSAAVKLPSYAGRSFSLPADAHGCIRLQVAPSRLMTLGWTLPRNLFNFQASRSCRVCCGPLDGQGLCPRGQGDMPGVTHCCSSRAQDLRDPGEERAAHQAGPGAGRPVPWLGPAHEGAPLQRNPGRCGALLCPCSPLAACPVLLHLACPPPLSGRGVGQACMQSRSGHPGSCMQKGALGRCQPA